MWQIINKILKIDRIIYALPLYGNDNLSTPGKNKYAN